jgi:hypothetical protein
MATMTTTGRKKTGMTQARDAAQARIAVLAAIAAHAQGNPKDQQARAARRAYRQNELGIQDLRQATADQVAAAHKDPRALLSAENVAAQRDALAYAQAHGGTGQQQPPAAGSVTPGKSSGPTSLGGRPVLVAGPPAVAPAVLAPQHMLVAGVKAGPGKAPKLPSGNSTTRVPEDDPRFDPQTMGNHRRGRKRIRRA